MGLQTYTLIKKNKSIFSIEQEKYITVLALLSLYHVKQL